MQSHRRRRAIRALVLGLAACTAVAAPAAAQPAGDPPADSVTARWQSYDEQVAKLSPEERAVAFGTDVPTVKVGDTPADFAQPVAPAPKAGDTPIDHPGASRAPDYTAPTTIQVVRPERTIVRDVDEVLPVVLSSAALLVALGGCAFLLFASIRRRRLSSSH